MAAAALTCMLLVCGLSRRLLDQARASQATPYDPAAHRQRPPKQQSCPQLQFSSLLLAGDKAKKETHKPTQQTLHNKYRTRSLQEWKQPAANGGSCNELQAACLHSVKAAAGSSKALPESLLNTSSNPNRHPGLL